MNNVLQFVKPPVPEIDQRSTGLGICLPTLVKVGPGWLLKVNVLAGVVWVYDCASLADAGPENLIFSGTATGRPVILEWPILAGLAVVPRPGSAVSIIYV